jgi:hypothetical protein
MNTANSFNGRPHLDVKPHEIENDVLQALTGLNRVLAQKLIDHGYWTVIV